MGLGVLTGIVLLVLCELKAARRYSVTANALDAAAIAILFSTFFASHALWHLLALPVVFGLMVLVTIVAVLLSIRRESIFIALLGLVGGFATPALLSTGEDRPIGLFSYLLLLNAGLAWVAYKKRWQLLTALALLLTVFYQWAWVFRFLDRPRLPLAVGIFLVFPILGLLALILGSRGKPAPRDPIFAQTAALGSALPLLFALYMAAVPNYGGRYVVLFGFLFLMAAGLAAIAIARGPAVLHLVGAISTLAVLLIWFVLSYTSAAWPAILVFLAGFVLLYICADLLARRVGRPLAGSSARATLAAPLALFGFPALVLVEPATASPALLFSTLFVLLAVLALFAVRRERGEFHFLSAFFALAAEAAWSARHLTPPRLLPALTIYAVFALFYLGVPLLARRRGKTLRPEGSGAILLFVSLTLLFFLAAGPVAAAAIWGVALLLAILNVGLFVEGSAGRQPLLSVAGIILSWIVIAVWWSAVNVTTLLFPALIVVAGFAVLTLGGNLWAQKKARVAAVAPVFGNGLYLGLVGHLFLFFVASQKPLSIPPWPFLGVLGVLDLAIGVAALSIGRGELALAALAASQFILMLWVSVAQQAPWPSVGIVCAGGVALLGLGFFFLARQLRAHGRREDVRLFAASAALAVFLGQGVAIASSGALHFRLDERLEILAKPTEGSPAFGLALSSQIIAVIAVLIVAWLMEWHSLAVMAVVSSAVALFFWRGAHFQTANWGEELLFAAAINALFFLNPLLLGSRSRRFLDPYLAAVLANVPFFFLARHSLVEGGYGDRIGLLPVGQAALLALLLLALLRLEPAGQRSMPRLALVAGAALAFVTVAIPLQLEKQWITIGLALEAAALGWLYRRLPHRGLLLWATGLAVTVFVRLSLNPAVLSYHPRQGLPIWNWYLYTYLVSAAALLLAARFLRATEDRLGSDLPRISVLLPAAAAVLLFLLLNIEIADFYSVGQSITFNFSAALAQDLTYTLGWALFAIALLLVGILLRSQAARISSLVLLVATIFKCFVHDLWRLGGLYRVGSFVGLAICLALVAVALQKFVLSRRKEAV